jgi:hypothetical protein
MEELGYEGLEENSEEMDILTNICEDIHGWLAQAFARGAMTTFQPFQIHSCAFFQVAVLLCWRAWPTGPRRSGRYIGERIRNHQPLERSRDFRVNTRFPVHHYSRLCVT